MKSLQSQKVKKGCKKRVKQGRQKSRKKVNGVTKRWKKVTCNNTNVENHGSTGRKKVKGKKTMSNNENKEAQSTNSKTR